MWTGIKLIPDHTKIDFIGTRYIGFAVTAVMIIASIFLLATKGLNYGIDFTGGTLIEIATEQTPELASLREDLNNLDLGEISIQEFGAPNNLLIRVPAQDSADPAVQKAAVDKVKAGIETDYQNVDYRRVEFVGPQVGQELKVKGLIAVVAAIVGIMAYVWFRFEWQFGVAAVVTLAHDVFAVLGFMAIMGRSFDLTSLAALLMVAGFSINDTVVIFDRIREMMRKYRKKPMGEICNLAINDTLSRTVMTSLVTLLSLVALAVFGGEVISGFTEALLFGFLVGTYSSIYVASAILLHLGLRPAFEEKPA
ncbi:MAG: protein translocase subunit SecF [Micavibrio aeruginosavorus]|uniref:Protein-export membrane protein SecF n=1 Tax=Micavibrio aeruginosavorus TaxID=349221 RepID=A0A2W5PY99_9BACT|nr:MAG: protein translocase subunit SecF [Micavibrio aeruginosavorus]